MFPGFSFLVFVYKYVWEGFPSFEVQFPSRWLHSQASWKGKAALICSNLCCSALLSSRDLTSLQDVRTNPLLSGGCSHRLLCFWWSGCWEISVSLCCQNRITLVFAYYDNLCLHIDTDSDMFKIGNCLKSRDRKEIWNVSCMYVTCLLLLFSHLICPISDIPKMLRE